MKGKVRHLAEIFSSVQGEGLLLGVYQIFIRLAGCNINCKYCDTKDLSPREISADRIIEKVRQLDKDKLSESVVITGGEPLIHIDDVRLICELLKDLNYRIYLETNGSRYKELNKVIKYLDYISMDIKLPKTSGLPKPLWREHKNFLKIAFEYFKNRKGKLLFVKSVIDNSLDMDELKRAVRIIKSISRDIPFILQPITPVYKSLPDIKKEIIYRALKIARKDLNSVRVIPQIHKIIGVE